MKCIEYSELISAYVDQMISPQEEEKLMKHLKTCQVCQEDLKILKQIQTMCGSLEEVSLPDKFHDDLMKALKVENKVKAPIQFKWRYGGALVATMLVGILCLNQVGTISSRSKSMSEYATTNPTTESNMVAEAAPYAVQNEGAKVRMQDETDIVAKESQQESKVFMLEDEGINNVWQVQVEDSEGFIEALKGYLSAEQILYEQTEEGLRIDPVKDGEALTKWLQEHSVSFEGNEIVAESDVYLKIN